VPGGRSNSPLRPTLPRNPYDQETLVPHRGQRASVVGAIIVIIFGLFMLGMLKLEWLHRDLRFHGNIKGARPLGTYLIHLAFAFD